MTLTIYDVNGRVLRRFDLGFRHAGIYREKSRAIYWDGRGDLGEKVASGLYFYELRAEDFSAVRRMLIVK